MSRGKPDHMLRTVARMCGVATSYINYEDKQVATPKVGLIAMINALQEHAALADDPDESSLRDLIGRLRQQQSKRGLPAVLIAWDKAFPVAWLWLNGKAETVSVVLRSEDGEEIAWTQAVSKGSIRRSQGLRVRVTCEKPIPFGYYQIEIKAGDQVEGTSFLISAPRRAETTGREWGIFAPVHALRSEGDEGVGGYCHLETAARFTRRHGGSFVGTLPLLANYYEPDRKNISPYSPISRLFWNEIYLDLDKLPGVSVQYKKEVADQEVLVDYDGVYARKKHVLIDAAEQFFAQHQDGDKAYRAFAEEKLYLNDYAEFRAAQAPEHDREKTRRYHLYAQYACHAQLLKFKELAAQGECAELYIDYPIGLDSNGFDTQNFKDLFLQGFQVGAPPDMFFSKGQSWGFMPFNPRAFEKDKFEYFRATIHQYFRYARMLRLDHIMGFYRIYCIPDGKSGAEGAYIYYPLQAFLAVLCLEAHRHGGVLIGEDLGTVPKAVREGMQDHEINRMWILQFELVDHPKDGFKTIKKNMIACFNTHDTFPFASFMTGKDLQELQRLKLLSPDDAKRQAKRRMKPVRALEKQDGPFLYGLEKLGESPARFVLVNMEDLWDETEPQNIPGTTDEYPDWRKRFFVPLERWEQHDDINEALELLNQARKS
jgi:4-alpha-glucanotransferase